MLVRSPNGLFFPVLNAEPTKWLRLHTTFDMGGLSQRHAPLGVITSILVPRRQGRIPSSGPLPSFLDSDSWLWPYYWAPFLDTPFQNGDGGAPEIPVTLVRSEPIVVNDRLLFKFLQPFW